jgi:hypothetical protein
MWFACALNAYEAVCDCLKSEMHWQSNADCIRQILNRDKRKVMQDNEQYTL